jgi:hypothetical protein
VSNGGWKEVMRILGGKVGIGTTSPSYILDVRATDVAGSTSPGASIFVRSNEAVTLNKGGSILFGDIHNDRGMIKGASELGTGNTEGYLALSTRRAGGMTEAMRITSSGRVGIGTNSPDYLLHVNGAAAKPGGGSWTDSSDIRLKKNVKPIANALDKITSLKGVNYEWIEPENHGNLTGVQIGMIAQEVEKVFPEWVGTDERGYKDLTFRGFEALATEAIKELKSENDLLKSELCQKDKTYSFCN